MPAKRSTKALRAVLLLTTTAGLFAQPSQAASATPTRPLAKGEVLAVLTDPSVIEQTKPSKTPIKWPTTVKFSEASGLDVETQAKTEVTIETLECVGKPKPSCSMTVNGKRVKFGPKLPTEYLEIAFTYETQRAKPLFVIATKKPPMTLIVAKPVTE